MSSGGNETDPRPADRSVPGGEGTGSQASGDEPAEHVQVDVGLLRAAAGRWERALDTTLRSSVIPYGYTVTIWSSGGYLISLRGAPDFFEAFGFVAGALLAFAVLATLSARLPTEPGASTATQPSPDAGHPIFGAGLHIVAVGLALGGAAALDRLTGQFAWILASFAATALYLAAASGELAIAIEISRRELRLRAPRRIRRPR